MKSDPDKSRTRESQTIPKLRSSGWISKGNWRFEKNDKLYDLSAADLTQLDRIEKEGLFLVIKKYQEVNKPKKIKEGQLRVWHISQVPMPAFYVYVSTPKQAKLIIETLAIYDLFQLENKIKPDYFNVAGLEVYEGGEWVDWEDEEGNDIDNMKIIGEVA